MLKQRSALNLTAIVGSLLLASTVQAANFQRGEQLHNNQCTACHAARFGNNGAEIYTRPNHRVQSFEGLQRQVNRCKNNLEITWFDEDVADVVEYLNQQYYKFKP